MDTNGRIQSLDIIKGIAILMIFAVHYNQSFNPGFPILDFCRRGCQLFFVASGFGVAKSFTKKTSENKKKAILNFYSARFRSIAPAYYFMLLMIFLLNTVLIHTINHPLRFGTNRSFFGILSNILFIHGLFPSSFNSVMPGGWYIGTTMLLYFIAPFICLLFIKWKRSKKILWILCSAASLLILFVIALLLPHHKELLLNSFFGDCLVLTQFPCFCLGVLLYFEQQDFIRQPRKTANIFLISGVILIIISCIIDLSIVNSYKNLFVITLVGLSAFFILKAMMIYEQSHIYGGVAIPLMKLGKKSFFVFLTHSFFVWGGMTVLRIVFNKFQLNIDSIFWYLLLFPFMLLLSYFSGCVLQKIIAAITKKLLPEK